MQIEISKIKQLCKDVLMSHGVNESDSLAIIEEYLYLQLVENKTHNLVSFPKLVKNNLSTRNKKWKIEKEDSSYALINASGMLGQVVGRQAMDLAIQKAEKSGVAMIGIKNMHTYAPGFQAKRAADKGMVGIVMNNSKSRVAPYGGTEPILGTNPIGIAIPAKDYPIVLDMATSTRAMGEVRLAKKENRMLPQGMALDKNGESTTDPDQAEALIPFGGYKGYGLSLVIEILAGALVQAKVGSQVKSSLDRGYLLIAINPKVFGEFEDFQKSITQIINEIKQSKTAERFDEILIPGERAARTISEHLEKGFIDVDESVFEEIKNLS